MVIVISIIRIILDQIQCKLDDETYDTTEVLALEKMVLRIQIYSLGLPRLFDFLLQLFSSARLHLFLSLHLLPSF